jgi:hypothetical protein
VLALLAVPTALIGPALLPGKAFLPADFLVQFEPWKSRVAGVPFVHWDPLIWDGIAQYYPWRLFAAESLRSGIIPLWNPYQFCGTPFVANGQSAVFYPPNLIFWLLPTAIAFGWSAWLHLALTGWFSYLFLRRIGTGRPGAVAGALVWQGNGFLVAWIHLPTVLCTATWLPLVLLCVEQALVRGRARLAVAAGVALGISYLGGHPQVFLFVALLTAVYLAVRGVGRAWRRPPSVRQELAPALITTLAAAMVCFLSALALAAVQLLPTLDLLRIAHRSFTPGPESYRAFLSHAMPPVQLAGLLLPHAFGHPASGSYVGRDNYAEFACYVGIVALALALWAAFVSRTWHARFFGVTSVIVFLIVLGTPANWPLYYWLPGFARSGGPGRMLVLTAFTLSVLTGRAVDDLPRVSRRALIGLVFIIAALGWGRILWLTYVTPGLAQVQPGVLALTTAETRRVGVLLFAAFPLVLLAARRRAVLPAQAALCVILAADLLFASQGHLHTTPGAWVYPPVRVSAPDSVAGRQAGQGRILGNATYWPIDRFPDAVLPPNAATVYHLRDAFGYDSLYLARYRDFAAALEHGDPSPPLNGNMLLARLGPVYGLDMMSLAGVETVLSPTHIRGLKMETAGAYYTYSNPYARPRAWVASSGVFVPTHLDAVVSLAELGPMQDTIIITGPDDLGPPSPHAERGTGGEVTLRDLSPNAVEVTLTDRGGGYLFLADAYAPGWRASSSGEELPIRPADVAFRVVALPAGAESVLFRYEPDSFRVGMFITLLICALLGGIAAATLAPRGR